MSLQAKFAFLLGFVGLTVVLALAAGVISLNFMHTEVRRPFQIMSSALTELQSLKFAVERQRELVLATREEPGLPTAFDAQAAAISESLKRLVANESVVNVTGKTSIANLRNRLAESRDLSETSFLSRDATTQSAAAQSLSNAFSLIRHMETRIIGDTHPLLNHAADIRGKLLWISGIILLLTTLTLALGILLVRRWVLNPVADLRTAAIRIAGGDFEHRIPIRGRDELAVLSTEVNTMAATVKSLQDEAIQRERLAAIGEMVRRIAHNLRSPLAGIRGLAELTRNELDSPTVSSELRSDIGENQNRIIGAVDRFELWLKDLLSATKPLEIINQKLDPRDWIVRLVDAYRPKAQANRIILDLDLSHAPASASFDPRHLEIALGALISNALDSVSAFPPPPDKTPTVRIACHHLASQTPSSPGSWELQIQDNGPGVAPHLRDRIFAPYFTTKREGTGIGLALAQQVFRAHGGDLTLLLTPHDGENTGEAAPSHQGAVFLARLPIGPIEVGSSGVATAGHPETPRGQNSRH